jgi:hypothetical protein
MDFIGIVSLLGMISFFPQTSKATMPPKRTD